MHLGYLNHNQMVNLENHRLLLSKSVLLTSCKEPVSGGTRAADTCPAVTEGHVPSTCTVCAEIGEEVPSFLMTP